jgi:hypothetical protein
MTASVLPLTSGLSGLPLNHVSMSLIEFTVLNGNERAIENTKTKAYKRPARDLNLRVNEQWTIL